MKHPNIEERLKMTGQANQNLLHPSHFLEVEQIIVIVPTAFTPVEHNLVLFLLALVLGHGVQKFLELLFCHFLSQLTTLGKHYEPVLDIGCARFLHEADATQAVCGSRVKNLVHDGGAAFRWIVERVSELFEDPEPGRGVWSRAPKRSPCGLQKRMITYIQLVCNSRLALVLYIFSPARHSLLLFLLVSALTRAPASARATLLLELRKASSPDLFPAEFVTDSYRGRATLTSSSSASAMLYVVAREPRLDTD